MSINECISEIEELVLQLHQPWNDIADSAVVSFAEIAKQGGVGKLVVAAMTAKSIRLIRGISFLLTDVEIYKQEISALYHWIDAVFIELDDRSTGNLTTAIQRHIAILDIKLPLASEIAQVMIPFLLKSLTRFDWTTRNAAVLSFDMLDGLMQLNQWLTRKQVIELQENLQVHLQLEEGQGNTPNIGRLWRFVER